MLFIGPAGIRAQLVPPLQAAQGQEPSQDATCFPESWTEDEEKLLTPPKCKK